MTIDGRTVHTWCAFDAVGIPAARARGLDTCVQAAWIHYHHQLAELLDFAPEEMLVCGMALGHADPAAPENRLVTERAPVDQFTTFHE